METIELTDNILKVIESNKKLSHENQTDLEQGSLKCSDTVAIIERGVQLDLAERIIQSDLPDEEYIKYRNYITTEYVNKKLIEYEYSKLLNLPKWKNCEPYSNFKDIYKLMTFNVMKQWKRNYKTNFRMSSEDASMNTIIKRYFGQKKQYSYEISAYPSVCREWVRPGVKEHSEEAKVTLLEEGEKFFEMYHRAIELWYERDFLNKYEKNNQIN